MAIIVACVVLWQLADALQARRWRTVFLAGIGLPASLGVIALMLYATRTDQVKRQEGSTTRKYQVASIRVMNGSATMYADKNYYVTFSRGPVGKEGIPELVKVGDKITVTDRSLTVNHIFVTEILEDMSYSGKVFARNGEVRCVLVERPEDKPGVDDNYRNRQWINITDCKPLSP